MWQQLGRLTAAADVVEMHRRAVRAMSFDIVSHIIVGRKPKLLIGYSVECLGSAAVCG